MPGAFYFPELVLMHAAARAMLDAVLASVDHRDVARKLHDQTRADYNQNKQQKAELLTDRRLETDDEAKHRLALTERAFTKRVDECDKEVVDGRERAVAQVAKTRALPHVTNTHQAAMQWARSQRQLENAPQPRRGRKKSKHNRQRSQCKDCGGDSIWQHNRIRSRCNDFGGVSICYPA
jgi:hypothetical protein